MIIILQLISRNLSKGVHGHFERKFQTEWSIAYQPTHHLVSEKLRVVSKYPQCIVWFGHKARVLQTDGRTDRWADRITTYPRPR